MIVGTAGHIDHGKTALVRALTGVDADRLPEEKARGITLDLGFAYWPRPDGQVIGFIDVPGHEKLVHNMLAGATGIDLVLLVVAADDGIMPQTREHLAILDLLALKRGIVALTKSDLVDEDRRREVAAEITMALARTGLADAEILPVSAVTGEGIDALAQCLDALCLATAARAADGRFRLAVDRSFTLVGTGTIITGTVLSGQIAAGDAVTVSPSGLAARVRSLHVQNRPAEQGQTGQRCALALSGAGVTKEAIGRGDMVLDPSLHAPTSRIDARLRVLKSETKPIGQWMPVRFHHGASDLAARLVVLRGEPILPGETDLVQIVLEKPIAAVAGDCFIIRDTSASRTIGGGVLIDLRAPERKRRTPERRSELLALDAADPLTALSAALDGPRGLVDIDAFFRDRAAAATTASEAIERHDLIVLSGGHQTIAMRPETWRRFADAAVSTLDGFHAERPDLQGMGQERLRLSLFPRLPAPLFAAAVHRLVAAGAVVLDRAWLRRPYHEVRMTADEELVWSRARPLLDGPGRFRPPRVRDVSHEFGIDEKIVRRVFRLAARRGEVDEVALDHFFLAEIVAEMAGIAMDIASQADGGRFGAAEFRDRLENGRKVAIHILEYFDRQGFTMRRGDWRRINPNRMDLFSKRTAPAHGDGAPAKAQTGGDASPVGRPDFKSGKGRETVLGGFDSRSLPPASQGARR
jgi:selenocysteine-specific elongation factor